MLNIKEFEGKTEADVIKKINKELDLDQIIIKEIHEESGLLSNKIKYSVIIKEEIIQYLQEMVKELGRLMGNETTSEVKFEENYIKIRFDSDNNGIIIGKEGRTLQAIQYLINQVVRRQISRDLKVGIDVGNYKEEKQKNLERDIRFIADEVLATKVGVKLDYMNSYERRIVHSIINEYENLETRSEGETPDRFINIIYREK